jgi:protein TonB
MGNQQSPERQARLAGLFVVLLMHGALLYSLWHYRILPPPSTATTLFVDLLNDPPKPQPSKPKTPEPKPQPAKLKQPVQPPPQQLVAQAPVVSPTDLVAPPP